MGLYHDSEADLPLTLLTVVLISFVFEIIGQTDLCLGHNACFRPTSTNQLPIWDPSLQANFELAYHICLRSQ